MNYEEFSKVGSKGEIYPSKKLRKLLQLEPHDKIKLVISTNKQLIIEKVLSPEELLSKKPISNVPFEEIEHLSEEIQKSEGKNND